ncbi:MAG: homocysteine S-methyltransferase family protein [Terracidiphilus sp.]|jgi:methionine synthase I (cobalamin-dependent)
MARGAAQLQARGLPSGTIPDTWNLTHPEQVEAIARTYVGAGSQVILTNTFCANAIAMHSSSRADLDAINRAGAAIYRFGSSPTRGCRPAYSGRSLDGRGNRVAH